MTVTQNTEDLYALRRYARALTGDQAWGDEYVRMTLDMLGERSDNTSNGHHPRFELFRSFHRLWKEQKAALADEEEGALFTDKRLRQSLSHLPDLKRQVFLLVDVEGFSLEEAARILDQPQDEITPLHEAARSEYTPKAPARTLIIEDEPLIAAEIADLIESLGLKVAGTAANKDTAINLAESERPDVVLADIQLEGDDDGIVAAQEIIRRISAPIIFVTGWPERLLKGNDLEPAFVVSKPFDAAALARTIGYVLHFEQPVSGEAA